MELQLLLGQAGPAGSCVWCTAAPRLQEPRWERSPGKAAPSSSRLSLTHTASQGWGSLLQTAFHHLWAGFCSSVHTPAGPAFSRTVRPAAWPYTVTSLGWPEPHQPLPTAGSEPCSLLHSYLLFIFCFFQNFS